MNTNDAITVTQAIRDSLLTFWSAGAHAARMNKEAPPQAFDREAARLTALINTRTTSLAAQDGLDQKELPEVAAMRFIEILRSDIAASVTILTDNEDANYKSEQVAIEVCAEWTNWRDYRIYGESVLQCLAKAVGEREALSAIRENKS